MNKKLFFALSLLLGLTVVCRAETVSLKDGTTLKGSVRSLPNGDLEVTTQSGVLQVSKANVEAIDYDQEAPGLPAPSTVAQAPGQTAAPTAKAPAAPATRKDP